MTPRPLCLALCAVLALAGCSSSTNDEPGQEPSPTTTSAPTTSVAIREECSDVADKAQALVTEAGRLTTGDATIDQVRAAAQELSDAFDTAREAVEPDARAQLDEAGQALQRVQDAVAAQPVDTAGLRAAGRDLVTALGDAASICSPTTGSSAESSQTDTTAPAS
jgi:osmoprotectant transport system substrate-binding protein